MMITVFCISCPTLTNFTFFSVRELKGHFWWASSRAAPCACGAWAELHFSSSGHAFPWSRRWFLQLQAVNSALKQAAFPFDGAIRWWCERPPPPPRLLPSCSGSCNLPTSLTSVSLNSICSPQWMWCSPGSARVELVSRRLTDRNSRCRNSDVFGFFSFQPQKFPLEKIICALW